jgi:hypothetical protein
MKTHNALAEIVKIIISAVPTSTLLGILVVMGYPTEVVATPIVTEQVVPPDSAAHGTASYRGTMAASLLVIGVTDLQGRPIPGIGSGITITASIVSGAVEFVAGNADGSASVVESAIKGNPSNLGIGEGPMMTVTMSGRANAPDGFVTTTAGAVGGLHIQNDTRNDVLVGFLLTATAIGGASVTRNNEFAAVFASVGCCGGSGPNLLLMDGAIAPSDDQSLALDVTEAFNIPVGPGGSVGSYNFSLFGIALVPEPSTAVLLGLGILSFIVYNWVSSKVPGNVKLFRGRHSTDHHE